ncbi:MAG: O-methyltransferase [Saprospiraceae bacterium]
MGILNSVLPAINFYLNAKTLYKVHSPFVYDFTTKILDDNRHYYAFDKLNRLRSKLLKDQTKIPTVDFGAGSRKGNESERTVAHLAKTLLTAPKMSEMLFKIVDHYQCKSIVELGTALGVGSLYMAMAAPQSTNVFTIEGNPFLAEYAQQKFKKMDAANITSMTGTFEEVLPSVLERIGKVDLVYFDGHHQKQATMDYFNLCLPHAHEDSVFIFDDINWSTGMQEAWAEIKEHPKVTYSIDLFRAGIVFFKPSKMGKEHFALVPHQWKPWSAGFWG